MIVVWHIKYKLLGQKRNTESSMGKNQRQLRNIMENESAFSRSAIAAERSQWLLQAAARYPTIILYRYEFILHPMSAPATAAAIRE